MRNGGIKFRHSFLFVYLSGKEVYYSIRWYYLVY